MLARVIAVQRRWLGLVIAGGTAIVTALLARRVVAFDALSNLEPAALGFIAAVGAVAATSYRGRRDPGLLLLAAGSAAAAGQFLVMRVIVPLSARPDPVSLARFVAGSIYGLYAGWLALAICLAFVVPWRDRRGRSPLRTIWVALIVALPLLAFDALLLITNPGLPIPAAIRHGMGFGTLAIVLGGGAMIASVVAMARSLGRTGWYPWLAGAASALAMGFLGTTLKYLVSVTSVLRVALAWENVMPAAGVALLLAAILEMDRTETSRMRRATDRAEEVLGGRAEIASVIAHDVRSPVSSIKSIAASTIANYDRLDDAQRLEFVGMIDREAQHVLAVVHQMSVALKIDAGTIELLRRPTSLADVVRQAIDEADTRGREVEVDAGPGITANVDAKWLAEAIRQGIDNAVAFSPDGTPIRVAVEDGGEFDAVITIGDEGPGIPPDRREDVFQRFARWRPAGYGDLPGSGLGLFICRGIVHELGGEVTLGSRSERGTILRILLPRGME
jgi:signal transduction histidine kinase